MSDHWFVRIPADADLASPIPAARPNLVRPDPPPEARRDCARWQVRPQGDLRAVGNCPPECSREWCPTGHRRGQKSEE